MYLNLSVVSGLVRASKLSELLGIARVRLVPAECVHRDPMVRRSRAIQGSGNSRVRWLPVEASWSMFRSRREEAEPRRRWAQRVALRRGTKVGIVALARKLAGILYAMWRDGTTY